jgi:hypothetical protein
VSVSTSVFGSRSGARVPSVRSQPGFACAMIITAADWRAAAKRNDSRSHAMLAPLRAAYSTGSGAVSHRLFHEPCTFSVT